MRNSLKVVLFISALSPSLVCVGVARLLSGGMFWDGIYYVAAGLIGVLCSLYILSSIKWYGEEFVFQAKKVESNDAILLGVVVTYVLPFFMQAASITVWVVAGLIAVAAVIFWVTDAPTPSPLLRVMGWRFYKVESSSGMVYTLITQREIIDPSNIKCVKKLSGSMLLEVIT